MKEQVCEKCGGELYLGFDGMVHCYACDKRDEETEDYMSWLDTKLGRLTDEELNELEEDYDTKS